MGVGLVEEARLLATHAHLARSSAAAGNLAGARTHTEHSRNILFGKDDPRYGDFDGNGSAENPGDGFGLLRYAANADVKLLEAAESAEVTPEMADQLFAATLALANFAPANSTDTWSDQLIEQTQQILAVANASAAIARATAMRDLANRMVDGVDANQNGIVEPIAGEGRLDGFPHRAEDSKLLPQRQHHWAGATPALGQNPHQRPHRHRAGQCAPTTGGHRALGLSAGG